MLTLLRRGFLISRFAGLSEAEFLKLAYQKIEELGEVAEAVDDDQIDVSSRQCYFDYQTRGAHHRDKQTDPQPPALVQQHHLRSSAIRLEGRQMGQ